MSSGRGCPVACRGWDEKSGVGGCGRLGRRWILGIWKGKDGTSRGWEGGEGYGSLSLTVMFASRWELWK